MYTLKWVTLKGELIVLLESLSAHIISIIMRIVGVLMGNVRYVSRCHM